MNYSQLKDQDVWKSPGSIISSTLCRIQGEIILLEIDIGVLLQQPESLTRNLELTALRTKLKSAQLVLETFDIVPQ